MGCGKLFKQSSIGSFMNIKKELSGNRAIITAFSNIQYGKSVYHLLKEFQKEKICFVSLNKPASAINEMLYSNKIKSNKILYIDAVSKGVGTNVEMDNVIYVSSPAALTELSIVMDQILKKNYFSLIVIDALSSFDIYNLGGRAEKFTCQLISKIRARKTKAIFLCVEDDLHKPLVQHASLAADKLITPSLPITTISLLGIGLATILVSGVSVTGYSFAAANFAEVPGFLIFNLFSLTAVTAALVLYIRKLHLMKPLPSELLYSFRPSKQKPAVIKKYALKVLEKWLKK